MAVEKPVKLGEFFYSYFVASLSFDDMPLLNVGPVPCWIDALLRYREGGCGSFSLSPSPVSQASLQRQRPQSSQARVWLWFSFRTRRRRAVRRAISYCSMLTIRCAELSAKSGYPLLSGGSVYQYGSLAGAFDMVGGCQAAVYPTSLTNHVAPRIIYADRHRLGWSKLLSSPRSSLPSRSADRL